MNKDKTTMFVSWTDWMALSFTVIISTLMLSQGHNSGLSQRESAVNKTHPLGAEEGVEEKNCTGMT